MEQKNVYLTECPSCSFTLKINGNFCRTVFSVGLSSSKNNRVKEEKEQHNSTISHRDVLFAYITIIVFIEAKLV